MTETQKSHFLESFVNPRSIAFFGANEEILKNMGSQQLLNLIDGNYKGKIYPIHPRLDSVFGYKAYKKVSECPEVPDLAVIILPTRIVHEIFEELGQFGVKNVVLVTAGFRETNNLKGEKELKEIAKRYGFRFLGPNCIGFINTRCKIDSNTTCVLNCTYIHYPIAPGNVSIVSQSGTFASHTNFLLKERDLKFAKVFSVGNEANIDVCDCLEYLENDPETDVILMYLEEIKRGRIFKELAARITRKKPIIAIYVGGTACGARAVSSHTGSMGGNDAIFNAVFKQTGIVRVYNFEEWVDTAMLFSKTVPYGIIPRGNRLVIVTNSGGPAATMADMCSRLGIALPELSKELQAKLREHMPDTAQTCNPVDYTFNINPSVYYGTVPKILAKSDEIDAMICFGAYGKGFFDHGPIGVDLMKKAKVYESLDLLKEIVTPTVETTIKIMKKNQFPLIFINMVGLADENFVNLNQMGIPTFKLEHQAIIALKKLMEYGDYLRSLEKRDLKEPN